MEKVTEIHNKIKNLRDQIKEHAQQTSDPKCAALCETSGEVLSGMEKAFDHYLHKSEPVWQ